MIAKKHPVPPLRIFSVNSRHIEIQWNTKKITFAQMFHVHSVFKQMYGWKLPKHSGLLRSVLVCVLQGQGTIEHALQLVMIRSTYHHWIICKSMQIICKSTQIICKWSHTYYIFVICKGPMFQQAHATIFTWQPLQPLLSSGCRQDTLQLVTAFESNSSLDILRMLWLF